MVSDLHSAIYSITVLSDEALDELKLMPSCERMSLWSKFSSYAAVLLNIFSDKSRIINIPVHRTKRKILMLCFHSSK